MGHDSLPGGGVGGPQRSTQAGQRGGELTHLFAELSRAGLHGVTVSLR